MGRMIMSHQARRKHFQALDSRRRFRLGNGGRSDSGVGDHRLGFRRRKSRCAGNPRPEIVGIGVWRGHGRARFSAIIYVTRTLAVQVRPIDFLCKPENADSVHGMVIAVVILARSRAGC